jgi:hypothetical protein
VRSPALAARHESDTMTDGELPDPWQRNAAELIELNLTIDSRGAVSLSALLANVSLSALLANARSTPAVLP